MITIRTIPNLLSDEGRTERQAPYAGGMLADYLPYGMDGQRVVLARVGTIPREDWATTPVEPHDEIILTPDVRLGLLFWQGTWSFIIRTAISYGIAYAIQRVRSKPAKPVTGDSSVSDSQTYGWDGIRTSADVGIPIPVIYGVHRVGGNYVNAFITNETHEMKNGDGETEQHDDSYLHVLLALGVGPIWGIAGIERDCDPWDSAKTYHSGDYVTHETQLWKCVATNTNHWPSDFRDDWDLVLAIGDKIEIDGNPIANLSGVDIWTRLGNDQQSVIRKFGDIHNSHELHIELLKNQPTYLTTENDDVEAALFNFMMPSCIKSNKKGGYDQPTPPPTVDIYYRAYDPDVEPSAGTWPASQKKTLQIKAKSMNEVRRSIRFDDLEPGRYQFKIVKTTYDTSDKSQVDLYLNGFDEIQKDDLSYPGIALLGLRLLATNQLSGSLSNVTVEVKGRRIATWTSGAPDGPAANEGKCNNPVWALRDFLTDRRYGIGRHVEVGNIDQEAFQREADYCDALVTTEEGVREKRFLWDGVIDSSQSATDWLSQICETFRCSILWNAGVVTPVIEKPYTVLGRPFGMGNIKAGSFSASYTSLAKRPNVVEVQFLSADNGYERESVQYEDYESIDQNGGVVRKQTIFLPGITRASQALRMARYIMNHAAYCVRAIAFVAAIEAVTCHPQDVIPIAHDVPQWGQAFLSWSIPPVGLDYGLHDHTELYVSQDAGKTWRKLADVVGDSYDVTGLTVGQSYSFKARSMSKWRVASAFTATVTLVAKAPRPANVAGLELRGQGNNYIFSGHDAIFDWRAVRSYTAVYPAGREPYGAGSGAKDPYIAGYQVEIWVANRCVRQEKVTDPRYVYSFEKNKSDNKGAATRTFTVAIYALDIYNQRSVKPATLTVLNPIPKPIGNKAAVELSPPGGFAAWGASGLTLAWADKSMRTILMSWEPAEDTDIVGYRIYRRQYLAGSTPDEMIHFTNGAPDEAFYWRTVTTCSFTDRAPTDDAGDPLIYVCYAIVPYDKFGADIKTNVLGQAKVMWSTGAYYRKNS